MFDRLQTRYGSMWTGLWKGLDMEAVKADWAEELAGYAGSPDAIKHGLAHLSPDRPPNAAQFAALCRNAPRYLPPLLAAPRFDSAAALIALRALARPKSESPKAWAYRLRDKDQKMLTAAQRSMWPAALAPEMAAT